MEAIYGLLAVLGIIVVLRAGRYLRRRDKKPMILYHKPTGRLITIPSQYESAAVDLLIKDLKELPPHAGLDSAEFQVLRAS